MAYRIRCERCGVALVEDRVWQVQEAWRKHTIAVHKSYRVHRASVEVVNDGEV